MIVVAITYRQLYGSGTDCQVGDFSIQSNILQNSIVGGAKPTTPDRYDREISFYLLVFSFIGCKIRMRHIGLGTPTAWEP